MRMIVLVTCFFLQSCSAILNSVSGYRPLDIPQSKQKKLTPAESRRISWLIRDILPAKRGRAELESTMLNAQQVPNPEHGAALTAGAAGALATGAPLSPSAGHVFGAVGMGVSVVGSLSRGPYFMILSRLYLTEAIEDPAAATRHARMDMLQRFLRAAHLSGLDVQCRTNCQGDEHATWRVYRLFGASEPLWAILRLADMSKAPPDPLRDQILGFTPTWQSQSDTPGQTVTTHSIAIVRVEPKSFDYKKNNYGFFDEFAWDNPVARQLLKAMSGDGRWVFAWNVGNQQNIVAWAGRLFVHRQSLATWGDRANLIEYEITE